MGRQQRQGISGIRFVSGHGFDRADRSRKEIGLQPLRGISFAGAKARLLPLFGTAEAVP
jgi:hypothetical protein